MSQLKIRLNLSLQQTPDRFLIIWLKQKAWQIENILTAFLQMQCIVRQYFLTLKMFQ